MDQFGNLFKPKVSYQAMDQLKQNDGSPSNLFAPSSKNDSIFQANVLSHQQAPLFSLNNSSINLFSQAHSFSEDPTTTTTNQLSNTPNQHSTPIQQPPNPSVPNDLDDDDDLDDLQLFHQSSLTHRSDPKLPICIDQDNIYVKPKVNTQGQTVVGCLTMGNIIGRGSFGIVYKAVGGRKAETRNIQEKQQPLTNIKQQAYAIKVYNLQKLRRDKVFLADGTMSNGIQILQNQLNILKRLNHPNITRCLAIYRSRQQVYSVNELCDLGQIMTWCELKNDYVRNDSVFSFICKKYGVTDLDHVARIVGRQLCQAVQYLHINNITNRDIKVDNILCQPTAQPYRQIKLTDFTTVRYSMDDISYFASGTPGFRAPQHQFATSEGYSSRASDIWSIGVSMYVYYYEKLPFSGENALQMDISAKNTPVNLSEDCPGWFRKLIDGTMAKSWKDRITIQQAIKIINE